VLAAAASAEDARTHEANALYKEFVKLGRKPGRTEYKRRAKIIWRLGELLPQSREALLKIPARSRVPYELVLVAYQIGDIETPDVRDLLVKHATRFKEPVLAGIISERMIKNFDEVGRAWVADVALKSTNEVVCELGCHLAWGKKMKGAGDALRALQKRSMRNRKRERTTYLATGALLYSGAATREEALAWAKSDALPLRMAAARVVPYLPPEGMGGVTEVLLRDTDWRIRRRTLRSIGGSKHESHWAHLITALEKDPRLACRATAHDGLVQISKRDLDYDVQAWRRWLKDRKTVPVEQAKKRTYSHARYYGQSVVADRVCFVVDLSTSMKRPTNHPTPRIAVARSELKRALEGLSESTRFNIVVFSNEARAWRQRPTQATKKRIAQAQKWIDEEFTPGGQTHTWQAIELAFATDKDLDTIYLLSDGSPSMGKWRNYPDTAWALDTIVWKRQITVHTVALSLSDLFKKKKGSAEEFGEGYMRRVAKATGGRFTVIATPPE